jgi:hypothetical protein
LYSPSTYFAGTLSTIGLFDHRTRLVTRTATMQQHNAGHRVHTDRAGT